MVSNDVTENCIQDPVELKKQKIQEEKLKPEPLPDLEKPKLAKRPTIEELRFDNPIFESKTEKKPNDMFIPMDPPAKRNSKP
jgi:hypothetical protein